jgi:hypothetical protein
MPTSEGGAAGNEDIGERSGNGLVAGGALGATNAGFVMFEGSVGRLTILTGEPTRVGNVHRHHRQNDLARCIILAGKDIAEASFTLRRRSSLAIRVVRSSLDHLFQDGRKILIAVEHDQRGLGVSPRQIA